MHFSSQGLIAQVKDYLYVHLEGREESVDFSVKCGWGLIVVTVSQIATCSLKVL